MGAVTHTHGLLITNERVTISLRDDVAHGPGRSSCPAGGYRSFQSASNWQKKRLVRTGASAMKKQGLLFTKSARATAVLLILTLWQKMYVIRRVNYCCVHMKSIPSVVDRSSRNEK
jgi:hypothetical protein